MLVSLTGRFVLGVKFILQHTAESLLEHEETGERSRQRIQGAAVVGALLADFTQICSSDVSLLSRPLKIVGDASLYDIDIYATHNSTTDFWCKH